MFPSILTLFITRLGQHILLARHPCLDVPRDPSFDTWNDGLQLLRCESRCTPGLDIHTNVPPQKIGPKHLRWCPTRSIIRYTKGWVRNFFDVNHITLPHRNSYQCTTTTFWSSIHVWYAKRSIIWYTKWWFATSSMWITLRSEIEMHVDVAPLLFGQEICWVVHNDSWTEILVQPKSWI